MALTINTQPSSALIWSAYRPIQYEVDSNDGTIVNIIADIWLDGAYYKTITHPANAVGTSLFDVQTQLAGRHAALLKANEWHLPDIGDGTITSGNSYDLSLQIKFFEQTENASSGLLESDWEADGAGSPVGATSNTVVVLPAAPQQDSTTPPTEFMMGDANSVGYTPKLFMTNAPRTQTIYGLTQDAYVSAYIAYADPSTTKLSITKYNAAGTPLSEHREDYTATGYTIFPCGSNNINDLNAGFIDSSVAYYELKLIDDDLTVEDVSETLTFNLDMGCNPIHHTFQFMNQSAGWDTFVIRDSVSEKIKIERTKYGQFIGADWNSKSAPVETLAIDSSIIYRTQQDDLTLTESIWLYQLVQSNIIYLDKGGVRFTVNIAPGTFEVIAPDDPSGLIAFAYSLFDLIKQDN